MRWAAALSALKDPWLDDAGYLNIISQVERSLEEPGHLQDEDGFSMDLFGRIVAECHNFFQTTSSEEVRALAPTSLRCFRTFLQTGPGDMHDTAMETSPGSASSTGAWASFQSGCS